MREALRRLVGTGQAAGAEGLAEQPTAPPLVAQMDAEARFEAEGFPKSQAVCRTFHSLADTAGMKALKAAMPQRGRQATNWRKDQVQAVLRRARLIRVQGSGVRGHGCGAASAVPLRSL